MDEHEGQGHGDVTLSFTRERADGMWLHQAWTICECSVLVARLTQLLGPPEFETVATPEAHDATAAAVLAIPGAVHSGEGL